MDPSFLSEVESISARNNQWVASGINTMCKLHPGEEDGMRCEVDLATCIGNNTKTRTKGVAFLPQDVSSPAVC
jgi:hypothetical protein